MSSEASLNISNAPLKPTLPAKQPLTELVTVEQRTAFAMYLIDGSVPVESIEPADFSFFDIDCVIFAQFIEEAEKLPRSARLTLAISLLGEVLIDVLLLEQQRTQSILSTLMIKAGGAQS